MTHSPSLPPRTTTSLCGATDAIGDALAADGVLLHIPPSQAELVMARAILKKGGVDDACVARCCTTLAQSADPGDQLIAREVRRARLWADRAESATRVLSDADPAEDADDAAWDCAMPWPVPEFTEPARIGWLGWALILAAAAALVIIAGSSFGGAVVGAEIAIAIGAEGI